MDQGPDLIEMFADMKSQRVKVDESFVPALYDETAEVAHLLADPRSENVSVDGVLCFGMENPGKCSGFEDLSYGFDYGFRTNYGRLDYFAQGEDDLKLEVLNGLLDDIDEVDDIHAANDLSGACEDFLLDIEMAEKVYDLDSGPSEGSHLGNSSSGSHSPGFSGSCNAVIGISESSTASVLESECKNDSLDEMVTCELHSPFRSKCGCPVPVEDKCPSSNDVHICDELDDDDDDNVLLSSILAKCRKRAKSSALLRTKAKRLRKPTRRYIEEFPNKKSGYLMGEKKDFTTAMKDKHLKVKSHEESFNETGNPTQSEAWIRGGRLKKCVAVPQFESVSYSDSDSDSDYLSASDSDDDHVRKKKSRVDDRRKHHQAWTLSEVTKLIDGISEYGVGQWTKIKNVLFSSSAYRTPLDMRDKWRNLLRASGLVKKNKGKVEQTHVTCTIPQSLLSRVHELAAIHPYPAKPYSKVSSKLPNKTKGAPFNPLRKKCK